MEERKQEAGMEAGMLLVFFPPCLGVGNAQEQNVAKIEAGNYRQS